MEGAKGKEQARGRGKGGGQKKQLHEVLQVHPRAKELITKTMRSQGTALMQPSELRAMSEMNPSIYHFYLDFVNYCYPSHMVQSDEQQWEHLCKALKRHFEKEFGSNPQKPPQPARPNNTLGDFITIETKAAKKSTKGAGPARAGGGGGGRGAGGRAQEASGVEEATAGCASGGGGAGDAGGAQGSHTSWVCPRCTLRNEPFVLECAACGFARQQAAMWAEFPPLG